MVYEKSFDCISIPKGEMNVLTKEELVKYLSGNNGFWGYSFHNNGFFSEERWEELKQMCEKR